MFFLNTNGTNDTNVLRLGEGGFHEGIVDDALIALIPAGWYAMRKPFVKFAERRRRYMCHKIKS